MRFLLSDGAELINHSGRNKAPVRTLQHWGSFSTCLADFGDLLPDDVVNVAVLEEQEAAPGMLQLDDCVTGTPRCYCPEVWRRILICRRNLKCWNIELTIDKDLGHGTLSALE